MTRAGNRIDAGLGLLDRQILDKDGKDSGNVDDLELFAREEGGAPYVMYILAGPGALARRLRGRAGAWLESAFERLHHSEDPHPARIPFGVVKDIKHSVELSISKRGLDVTTIEDWVRDHFISKIPGAYHDPGGTK
ncbi:MAG: hypothetical protein ABR548_11290 [Actinomycetota bacterium]|nr:hypothetical protein [Actinomycetota bacterium]